MRKFTSWISGWYTTWQIKRHNPGLYEFLRSYEYDAEDMVARYSPKDTELMRRFAAEDDQAQA